MDPVERINMAGTAEVCAQMFGISREEQDAHALESFRRTLAAWKRGFYAGHVEPVSGKEGVLLDHDEYAFLREDVAAKPNSFGKAPLIFQNSAYSIRDFYRDYGAYIEGKIYQEGVTKATVTLYNSCPRSDGAAALIVAEEGRARGLGLEILAELKGWGYYGNKPPTWICRPRSRLPSRSGPGRGSASKPWTASSCTSRSRPRPWPCSASGAGNSATIGRASSGPER